jgi:ribosomal protein L37E
VSATPDPAGYRGERIALLTQHGKERVIAPRVGEWLGAEVAHVTGYDTDRLGTFNREIPRAGTQLEAAFAAAQRASSAGRVHLENDLRAHGNPTRMAVIASATDDLLRRTATRCPDCGRPGYGVTERIPGLPCADCGTPTRRVRAERVGCGGCGREELRELDLARLASPAHCDVCNP